MVSMIVGPEVVYFLQSRDQRFRRGYWSEWQICSPHYQTCSEARTEFLQRWCDEPLWLGQLRLVRGEFWCERLPLKTPVYATHKSTITVLARKAAEAAGEESDGDRR